MNKEEILAKSRKENKGADLVALEADSHSGKFAGAAAILLGAILNGIAMIRYNRALPEFLAIFFCYQAAQGLARGLLLLVGGRKAAGLGWLAYGFVMLAATVLAVRQSMRLWTAGA
ncbi:MAG: hypothetical protein IKI45_15715 [Oscillospiraceae bacterium]|nr:hypothetical protein [Oscillospiraceae bacterium]